MYNGQLRQSLLATPYVNMGFLTKQYCRGASSCMSSRCQADSAKRLARCCEIGESDTPFGSRVRGSTTGDGDDTIFGLGGDDYFMPEAGANKLFGGNGNDRFVSPGTITDATSIWGGNDLADSGIDTIDYSGGGGSLSIHIGDSFTAGGYSGYVFQQVYSVDIAYMKGIENAIGGTSADAIIGSAADNIISGSVHVGDFPAAGQAMVLRTGW